MRWFGLVERMKSERRARGSEVEGRRRGRPRIRWRGGVEKYVTDTDATKGARVGDESR